VHVFHRVLRGLIFFIIAINIYVVFLVGGPVAFPGARGLGPVSRKPRKLFGPVKPFFVHLYAKTERCIHLKPLV